VISVLAYASGYDGKPKLGHYPISACDKIPWRAAGVSRLMAPPRPSGKRTGFAASPGVPISRLTPAARPEKIAAVRPPT
jgi:hypothetical protein